MPENDGGEVATYIKSIRTAECTYFTIWAEMHYTYLKAERSVAPGSPAHGYRFTYMDSLKPPVAATVEAASNVLRNLGFLAEDAAVPEPSNHSFQNDGWSCGLHVVKWIELDLRRRRGEPRLPDPTVDDLRKRTNNFIAKIKGAAATSSDRRQEMKPHTAPTGEGGAAEALSVMEPKWDNLEDALEAAQDCQRCIATKFATKGCRACMGEFFEEIRQKASGRKRPLAGASAKD